MIKTRNAKNDTVIKSSEVIVSGQARKIDTSQQSDVKAYGDCDAFRLLCKESSVSQGWIKSTKVCNVTGGCLVQMETQQRNPDGSYALSQALTYCPGVHIAIDQEPRELLRSTY